MRMTSSLIELGPDVPWTIDDKLLYMIHLANTIITNEPPSYPRDEVEVQSQRLRLSFY